MNEGPWFIFMAVVMYAILMTRLDRLGKQIESTSALIRYDIAPTEERRDDILKQWKQMQRQAKTDTRRFWTPSLTCKSPSTTSSPRQTPIPNPSYGPPIQSASSPLSNAGNKR